MKTGMNLLLWADHVTAEHDGLLDQIKGLGFDAVEWMTWLAAVTGIALLTLAI